VTHEDFVIAWVECRMLGCRAVAERLGLDTHDVNCVATRLREQGVDLPPMIRTLRYGKRNSRFTDRFDADHLNRIIGERM